ncbi:MAG TPA: tetratricopeptide repeat protein, partial [Streptosporangiaceae bacterium]|nr:tetratricopeptide repeat protein [Streptosporangiaceae bacterium]
MTSTMVNVLLAISVLRPEADERHTQLEGPEAEPSPAHADARDNADRGGRELPDRGNPLTREFRDRQHPEHPDTLIALNSLAAWTGEAGDAVAARDQFEALLPLRKRVSGPEHPDTLIARANLARWTGEAGDPAAARDQYAALLPAEERVLGPEHPDTLIALNSLAAWTGEAGDAVAARDQFE